MSESLLPFNASELEKSVEAATCRAFEIPVPINTLWNPISCPENLLPWLAWALSVDTWDSEWPETIKRRVIAGSLQVHRSKGTLSSIRRVLRGLNIQADISEWFQHEGPPHTFRLTAWTDEQPGGSDAPILSASLYRNLVRVVNAVKPVRSHYDFIIGVRFNSECQFGNRVNAMVSTRSAWTPVLQKTVTATLVMPVQFLAMTVLRIDGEFLSP